MQPETLWVFIDESGNFDFSSTGTQHFVMTAVILRDPSATAAQMLALKYEQIERGSNQLDFHAAHNSHGTRLRVLDLIASMQGIESRTFIVNKHGAGEGSRDIESTLATIITSMTQCIRALATQKTAQLVWVFDTAFTAPQSRHIKQLIRAALAGESVPCRIHFHRVANEPNGQIADYIAWSHFRLCERNRTDAISRLDRARHTYVFVK